MVVSKHLYVYDIDTYIKVCRMVGGRGLIGEAVLVIRMYAQRAAEVSKHEYTRTRTYRTVCVCVQYDCHDHGCVFMHTGTCVAMP